MGEFPTKFCGGAAKSAKHETDHGKKREGKNSDSFFQNSPFSCIFVCPENRTAILRWEIFSKKRTAILRWEFSLKLSKDSALALGARRAPNFLLL
jgi:hypothetical protein